MLRKEEMRDHKHISSLINGAINEIVKEYKIEKPNHDISDKSFNFIGTNKYSFKDNRKYIEFTCSDVVDEFISTGLPEEDANIEHIKFIVREIIKANM
ncbi:hypothetical protein [Clostridium tagluense]|uniref:hypothetical protein n=1 Tax=Clostridium tagluense TaxID=360422 RepID=UPI001C6F1064|nr:hypothetical protein [Clostridium tagluense]MBW9154883.1 hypothetical protein [Clostridium tagluense]WLC64338.1 hypothetical protein KTC93_15870 [Clostridium tagluense]